MRERLKAIREAGARISGSQTQAAPGATPGFVAALRAARAETPAEPARIARRTPATAIVAITRHGVQLAACALPALPGARLYVPEKLASEAEEAAPGEIVVLAGMLFQIFRPMPTFDKKKDKVAGELEAEGSVA